MRVISGEFGGVRLTAPKGKNTRPTTDRNREALFSMLISRLDFAGLQVLDLFAGSGALGLEAVSRGAAHCVFVEQDRAACAAITENIAACQAMAQTRLVRQNALKADLGDARFDVVFLDPPYGKGLAEQALAALLVGGWLSADALLIVEEDKRSGFSAPAGFVEIERRVKGDTALVFLTPA